uniref:Zinc finger protein 513 n=1 Tax=Naja naja TaxID=35670 RepID=A0A8C6VC96_NAJNA
MDLIRANLGVRLPAAFLALCSSEEKTPRPVMQHGRDRSRKRWPFCRPPRGWAGAPEERRLSRRRGGRSGFTGGNPGRAARRGEGIQGWSRSQPPVLRGKMPRRKQRHPQPVKVDVPGAPAEPSREESPAPQASFLLKQELSLSLEDEEDSSAPILAFEKDSEEPPPLLPSSPFLQAEDSNTVLPELLFPFTCRACGLVLQADEGLGEPVCGRCSLAVLGAEPASPKGFSCQLCPFITTYPNHLARHMKTHSGEKPFACALCPYASAHLDNLKRHQRVHTGEKPYKCPLCPYACGNLANLKRHGRIHSGDKPFRCRLCPYSCNQSMNLKRHMLRHTGEKPFQCRICPYTTGHWDNYKRHQKVHGQGLAEEGGPGPDSSLT